MKRSHPCLYETYSRLFLQSLSCPHSQIDFCLSSAFCLNHHPGSLSLQQKRDIQLLKAYMRAIRSVNPNLQNLEETIEYNEILEWVSLRIWSYSMSWRRALKGGRAREWQKEGNRRAGATNFQMLGWRTGAEGTRITFSSSIGSLIHLVGWNGSFITQGCNFSRIRWVPTCTKPYIKGSGVLGRPKRNRRYNPYLQVAYNPEEENV